MNKKLRPLLKWTGGKFDEFALFADHIPKFERYIEPFFGGGGVFFALKPTGTALINDKSTDLINFYNQINKEEFEIELYKYVNAWDNLTPICNQFWDFCSPNFISYISGKQQIKQLEKTILLQFNSLFKENLSFNQPDFIIDFPLFQKTLLLSIADKAKRIKGICERENRKFNLEELKSHCETGIRSGIYLFFRKLLNKQYKQEIRLNEPKAAANWFFVREFCYASMFRFNKKGEFNIPYGGTTYNKKKLKKKTVKIFSLPVIDLFRNTERYNLDFEVFLKNIDLKPTDFIFLDPPYDSEFSEYDQSSFTQEDQKRLASYLINAAAKWMVVIKETDFIRDIYTHPKVKINTFTKNYRYNVMGRNSRGVTHLIICNY
jgi:DNA adenine methylase